MSNLQKGKKEMTMEFMHFFDFRMQGKYEKKSGFIVGATLVYELTEDKRNAQVAVAYCSSLEPNFSRPAGRRKAVWKLKGAEKRLEREISSLPSTFAIPLPEEVSTNRKSIRKYIFLNFLALSAAYASTSEKVFLAKEHSRKCLKPDTEYFVNEILNQHYFARLQLEASKEV